MAKLEQQGIVGVGIGIGIGIGIIGIGIGVGIGIGIGIGIDIGIDIGIGIDFRHKALYWSGFSRECNALHAQPASEVTLSMFDHTHSHTRPPCHREQSIQLANAKNK